MQGLPPVTGSTTDPGLEPRTPEDHFLPWHHTVSHIKSASKSLDLTSGEKTNILHTKGFPGGSDCKEAACSAGVLSLIPGLGRSPEAGIATHSRIHAWRVPWTEEPGGLQFMGLQSQTLLSD